MKRTIAALAIAMFCGASPARHALPPGFAYLSDVAPTIVQDVRYAGQHNLVGRPLPGYLAPVCVLTQRAARALAEAQAEVASAGLTLRVYDCYQPQRAAGALLAWSKNAADQRLKSEYYPRVEKAQLFPQGYLSTSSPAARGSAVALTVQRIETGPPPPWVPGQHSCIAPFVDRYHDGGIDMGTNFDCMDLLSRTSEQLGAFADTHRQMLADLMEKHGFKPYGDLWWAFVLSSEPFPKTRFDFPVIAK